MRDEFKKTEREGSYALVMRQRGEGCGYTIDCGVKCESLTARDLESARAEARARLIGNEDDGCALTWTGQDNDPNGALEWAVLVRVEEDLSIADMLRDLLADRCAARQRVEEARTAASERAEYDRLRRKFGGGT